jgi:hypothetical protein
MKSGVFWDVTPCGSCKNQCFLTSFQNVKKRMLSSGMLHHVALVRTDVSEELSASIIRVTRIGQLGTLAVTSNQCLKKVATQRNCHTKHSTFNWLMA